MNTGSSSNNNAVQLSSLGSTSNELIDAKLEEHQLRGPKLCPGCGHKLGGSKPDWVGLPAGVKFDPTDQELIEHLEAKVEGKSSKSHPLIDKFIPTIEGEDGICYTHPEKLPGVTRDGSNRHFFHRPSKAYTTGTRKRRKIQTECDLQGTGETRWHKTGKTRPVMVNGKQKGCKKILVLYTNFGKNRKPEKTNWVMHQYHLGQHEEERDGELVVSKIFYQTQPRQCNWIERTATTGDGGGASTSNDPSASAGKRESGSGSTSTSSMVTTRHCRDDQLSGIVAGGGGASAVTMSSLHSIDMQHLKPSDHFSFVPFRKGFHEAGIGDSSTIKDATAMSAACDDHHHHHQQDHYPHVLTTTPLDLQHHHDDHDHQHHHHAMGTSTTFHISRAISHPMSQIMSPSPLHHASIILDHDHDSFHVSRIMLQNQRFQQQEQTEEEQHDDKLGGGSSASGLEEIIMGCTSSASTGGIKEESSFTNTPDWLKYSSFWPDHENPHHHHG